MPIQVAFKSSRIPLTLELDVWALYTRCGQMVDSYRTLLGMKGLFKRLTKGPARHIDYFERYISWLLNKGYSDGTLIIEHVNSEKFVQFHKYVFSEKEFGIKLSFSKAKWSTNYFDSLMSFCSSSGHKYRIVEGSDGMQFLDIDFGTDDPAAFRFAKHVFRELFGHVETAKYYGFLENCRIK